MNIRDNGQLASVTDANGINASYAYNNLGDLTAMNYTAPGVPSLSVGFDRAGRVISKSFSSGIVEAYARTLDGMMASKAVIGNNMVPDVAMTYQYASGHTGIEGFSYALDGASVSTEIGYDAAIRVREIQSDIASVSYAYPSNGASLVETSTVQASDGAELVKTMDWDYRNSRINGISYSIGGSTVASYDYEYATKTYQTPTGEVTVVTDRIGKITREDGTYTEYQYDERNQLASSKQCKADGTPLANLRFAYQYDSIGNLIAGGRVGDDGKPVNTFTANDLNQHSECNWDNELSVIGYAATNATVTVNDVPCQRDGELFWTTVPLGNDSSAVEADITALAVYNDGTQDVVGDVSGKRFVSAVTETPVYDARGNLIEDSRFSYQGDAWGRLTTITSKNASPNFKLEFAYYPDGQRASKKYYEDKSGWMLKREHQFVYDGWNLVYEKVTDEQDSANSYTNTYTWGLDIAGQRSGAYGQSAGGIGGLLAITQVSGLSPQPSTYFPIADHNGNIHKLIDESGDVVANYVYSPFGQLIGEYGDKADVCSISTKI